MTPAELKKARSDLGLTADQLAKMLGYDRLGTIYDHEAGRKKPSGAAVLLLQAYLDGYRPKSNG
jgi:DNA-binding transcriptional regulator YiaG